ncbi:hypothetical protein AALP_AA2G020000 [Arabis alpina]|uniref:Uncharacterized protein n=1 Tax=Arabis alpina TaxID=50452 RepID=A0A087HER9_ARAAL|nr:hypothetical protein AALP_AA2G020000 [Arabis alpina]
MNDTNFAVLLILIGVVCANVGARQLEGVSKETKIGVSIPKTATTNGLGAELAFVSVTTMASSYSSGDASAAASPPGPSAQARGTGSGTTYGSVYAEGPRMAYGYSSSGSGSNGTAQAAATPNGVAASDGGTSGASSTASGGSSR